MTHRGCGGVIDVDPSIEYPYDSNEDGRVEYFPAYRCVRCGVEILGDAQINDIY